MGVLRVLPNLTLFLVTTGLLVLAYDVVRPDLSGGGVKVFLLGALVFSGLVLVKPRLGLYGLCFSVLLIPFDWRIPGLKFTSPSVMFVGAAAVAWATSVAFHRSQIRSSALYIPAVLAAAVTWMNLIRYGASFYNIPLVLSESLIIFLLSYHSILNRRHLNQFLIVLALAFLVRNAIDLIMTVASLESGQTLGAIRSGLLITGGTSTTESHLRGLLLPIFIAGTMLLPTRRTRSLFALTTILNVAWLSLAVTRTGMIGLVSGPVFVLALLPAAKRLKLIFWMLIFAALVVFLAGYYSVALSAIWESTQIDIDAGFEEGTRTSAWLAAANAFRESPWIGDSQGPSHSFFLGSARTMGLAFLVPFVVALWIIMRHALWLRRRTLDPTSQTLVIGTLAALMVAVPLNFVGTMLHGFVAFFFWLLVGVLEAVYRDVRSKHYQIVELPAGPAEAADAVAKREARSFPPLSVRR